MQYLVIIALLLISSVFSQSNQVCMDCHEDEEMTAFIKDTVEISAYINIKVYENSIHGDMDCIDCHTDIEDPEDHAEDLKSVNCAECHEDAQDEFKSSIHALAMKEDHIQGADCKDCHGKHNILPSDDENSMTFKLNIENTCGECHRRPDVLKQLGIRGDGPVVAYHGSVHDKILHEDPDKNAPTCISCHDYHNVLRNIDSHAKDQIPKTCGKCHEKILNEYEQSIHWKAVRRGHFESPVCNDCHGEHQIVSPKETDAVTNRLNLSSQLCADCHSNKTMMNRFGLDPERFSTYSRTYHGLAILKGSKDAANCVSCHEVHSIRGQSDSLSSIYPSNLLRTCRKCHEGANEEFAQISVHPIDQQSRNPIAYYVQNIYLWLVIVVIGGMFFHNAVIVTYYIRKKSRKEKESRLYQRFQPFEVVQHALLFVTFTLLAITGFALKFPDAFWVEWLVQAGMTEVIRANIHRVAAVIMIIISFIQAFYFIFHKSGRRDIMALIPKIDDIKHFWMNMKYHLFLSREKPSLPRFDYTEKAEYLALIWGTAVMALTGFVLWFPEFFASFTPLWTFEVSEIIHLYEAILATLAIIIWHWFFVIYHPDIYPLKLTWRNGKITEEELKHHHPEEYKELQQNQLNQTLDNHEPN
jgi:formate dehydrogenase gamma subunit